jgi:hypothetical protein
MYVNARIIRVYGFYHQFVTFSCNSSATISFFWNFWKYLRTQHHFDLFLQSVTVTSSSRNKLLFKNQHGLLHVFLFDKLQHTFVRKTSKWFTCKPVFDFGMMRGFSRVVKSFSANEPKIVRNARKTDEKGLYGWHFILTETHVNNLERSMEEAK